MFEHDIWHHVGRLLDSLVLLDMAGLHIHFLLDVGDNDAASIYETSWPSLLVSHHNVEVEYCIFGAH